MARALTVRLVALIVALGIAAAAAAEEPYPSKPVRLVVPQAPGGAADVLARILGQGLGGRWNRTVIVDNRAGAGGNIGTDLVAKSPPDGYTLLFTSASTQAINPSLYGTLPFDSVKDFETVATLATVPFVLVVNPKVPATSLQEFLALARSRPGEINYGSAGNGTPNHLIGAMLNNDTGIKLVHVPYKGAAAAITDVMGGQIEAAFASLPSVIAQIRQGSVRALAVTSARRAAAAPELPTIAESGVPGFDVNPWFGLLAPAGTPEPILRRLSDDVNALLKEPETRKALEAQGAEPLATTPAAFHELLLADVKKWAEAVKVSGARLD